MAIFNYFNMLSTQLFLLLAGSLSIATGQFSCGVGYDSYPSVLESHPIGVPIVSLPMLNVEYAFLESTLVTARLNRTGPAHTHTLDLYATPAFVDYVDHERSSILFFDHTFWLRCEDGSEKSITFGIYITYENNRAPLFSSNNYAFNVTLPWPDQVPITFNNAIVVRDEDFDTSPTFIDVSLYPSNLVDMTLTTREHSYIPDTKVDLFLKPGLSVGTHTAIVTATDGLHQTVVPVTLHVTQATCTASQHEPDFGNQG